MKERTLQILRYLTLPCLFSGLSLVADEQEGNSAKKPAGMTFCQTYDMVKTKEVTPYAGPVVDGGVDVNLNASYIFWHASQGGLEYAVSGSQSPAGPAGAVVLPESNFSQPQGRVISPGFKTSSGFKAGIGLDFSYDGWDLGLEYTWLHTHAKSSVASSDVSGTLAAVHNEGFLVQAALPGVQLQQLMSGATTTHAIQFLFPELLAAASSSWRLNFNVLDLELGRNFFISSKLLLRPHYGFKGTWQKQNNLTQYVADGSFNTLSASGYSNTLINAVDRRVVGPPTSEIAIVDLIQETYDVNAYQYYWGFGPRAGLDFSWLVSRNFSFFTNAAVSLLWGQSKDTRRDVIAVYNVSDAAFTYENYSPFAIRMRQHQVNVVVEGQMGLRYDYWFSNDEYRFRAEAAWENQLWFNQNQMVYGYHSYGDLSLQGLTVTFQFDF